MGAHAHLLLFRRSSFAGRLIIDLWQVKKKIKMKFLPDSVVTLSSPLRARVLQAVPVTRMKRDTLLAMRTRAKPSMTSLAADHRPTH